MGLIDINGLFDGAFNLVDQLVVDKDKAADLKFKLQELKNNLKLELLKTKTVPWVDAVVKIMTATTVFWRPMVTAAMTIFGAYAHYKGVELDLGSSQYIFDGAFPAWGVSRHVEKTKNK